jgi:GYF domain 2
MSVPLLVKIIRDGKDLGSYESREAVRLFVYGTLLATDLYWHEGMTGWAPLSELQASEDRRLSSERVRERKQEEARKAEEAALQKAQAEASAKEAKAILDAQLKDEAEAREPKPFVCHCCGGIFNKPLGGVDEDSEAIALKVMAILAVLFALLIGIGFGVAGIVVLGVSGVAIVTVQAIHSRLPSLCPYCKSTNFSRPEKTDILK